MNNQNPYLRSGGVKELERYLIRLQQRLSQEAKRETQRAGA